MKILFFFLGLLSLLCCEAKVIMVTLAGRRENLKILFRYADELLSLKLIDEYHVWDYTRNKEDENWLRGQSYLASLKNRDRFFLKHVQDKPGYWEWNEFYQYYAAQQWRDDDVLVKTDDDILFIDCSFFEKFIKKRREHPHLFLAFANTINNGVSAHLQYQLKMQPEPFPCECLSPLWRSGVLARKQHEHFFCNCSQVLAIAHRLADEPVVTLPVSFRFSPNFYAILGKDVKHAYSQVVRDFVHFGDEVTLVESLPRLYQRPNYIDSAMIVSHGSFYIQRESGELDEHFIQRNYTELADRFLRTTKERLR